MTEKLYDTDSYLYEFDCKVISIYNDEDYIYIETDRTAFFPEGGGQTCDKGTLNDINVENVQLTDGRIWHYIKNNEEIRVYIKKADQSLEALGYTEHAFAHMGRTASIAAEILEKTGYPERTVELAKIAGYMHDIGNVINRTDHAQSGAVMAFRLLDKMGMPADEVATIICAICNHDEGTAFPVNEVAAALFIADKSDVRRSRVRNQDFASFDIHDRVNYAVTESDLKIVPEEKTVTLTLTIDTSISSVMDYFEIFMQRMLLCRKAAEKLGLQFKLMINEQQLI